MPYVTVYQKPEFPPLLSLGWKKVTLDELRQLCVTAFPRSTRREGIMDCLEYVVSVLRDAGIRGKLWIDGSFLTDKDDPDDSDVILCMDGTFADNMTPEQQSVESWFGDPAQHLHEWLMCHSFSIARWPEGHLNHEAGEWNYAYWLRQWGFTRSDIPKGIAVIELT